MIGERKVRRSVVKGLPNGDALGVERVRYTAYNGLRAFLVNVPAWKMFEWGGVHNDQWRVNDGARVHQGGRKRILARFNNPRENTTEHCECVVGQARRQDPGRQSFGANGNGDFKGPMLAGEPGQSAGFSECDFRRFWTERAAWANTIEPNVPGGRNTTCPSTKCGASAVAMSACAVAGVGHMMSEAPCTALAMSAVTRTKRAS